MNAAILIMLSPLALLGPEGPRQAAPAYVDARHYPTESEGWQRFRAVETRLVRGFDQICGDTFCEGEYHNLQALRFRCSVEKATGRVHACAWTFTASSARVAPDDGQLLVAAPTWTCAVPLAPGTSLQVFLQTLERDDALHVPLPGSRESIYDALTECL